MLWAGPSLAAVGLLLATALSGAAAEGLGAGYPGPMDFNCTSPPLNVSFGDPIGPIACGTQLKKANPALKTAPQVTYLRLPSTPLCQSGGPSTVRRDVDVPHGPTFGPIALEQAETWQGPSDWGCHRSPTLRVVACCNPYANGAAHK